MKTLIKFFESLLLVVFLTSAVFSQTITLSTSTITIAEDGGTATLTATASSPVSADLTVNITYSGSAIHGTDYTGSTTIIITSGNTTGTTVITSNADNYFEGGETITATIASLSGGGGGETIGSPNHVDITINDAETISISRNIATIDENGGTVTFKASVDGGGTVANGDVTVTMDFTGGTATSGTDFTGAANITISDGNSFGTVTITASDDGLFEGNETILGTATAVSYGSLSATNSASSTITDDETISIIRNNPSIAENGGTVTFTASVDGGGTVANGNLTVTMSWTGTATASTDYTGQGDITISNGTSSGSVTLTATSDAILEGDETITGTITGLSYVGGAIGTASASSQITDDEQASLVSPANGATGQSLAPTLVWNDMEGADEYILEVYDDNAGSPGTLIFQKTDIADVGSGNQSYTVTSPSSPIKDNSVYHWRVAAKNTSVSATSAYSGYWSFTTSQQGNSGTTITDGTVDVSLTPTLNWDAVSGADKYLLKVGTTSGGTDIYNNYDVGNATSFTIPAGKLTYNTTYYWSVEAQNASRARKQGETEPIYTSSEMRFRTLLATPTLSSPSNNSTTTDRTPTLTWSMAGNTSGVTYDITYTFNGGAPVTITSASSGATTSYTFPSNMNWGRYTWKVTANDGTGLAGNKNTAKTSTSTYTFDIVPSLVAPVNGLTGVAIEPKFEWDDGGSIDYTIQVTTTSGDYSSPVFTKTVNSTTSYQSVETDNGIPLNNFTVYYWRIRVDAGGGSYLYSPEWHFKTWPVMTVQLWHPANGMQISTTTNTNFSWSINDATGSLKYKPQIVEKTSSPTPAEWAATTMTTTTTSTSHNFTLTAGTQYYWRVVVLNSSNQVVAYSSEATFTTTGGASVTLYPSWPVGGATVYTTTPTGYWYPDVYASGLTYQINYATSNSVDANGELNDASATKYPSAVGSFSSNQYITFPALTAGQTYYWQVRAYYATKGEYSDWSSVASFKVNNTNAVVVPTPSYPTGGVTVYTTAPYLYWYLDQNATGLTYEIDYADNTTHVDGTADVTGINNLNYQLSGLTPGKTYEWRVRSNNGTTTSNWSSTVTFTVSGGVSNSSPVVSWPTGNPTIYSSKPTLSWYLNGSTNGITGYVVKYSTSSQTWSTYHPGAPSATGGEISVSGVNNTSYTLTTDLTYGQKYYWAVCAVDASSNESSYSSDSFTIVGGANAGTPILTSPIGGVTVYSTTQTLNWYFNGTSTGIQGYDVHYSKDGFLTTDNTIASALSSTSTSVNLTGLTPGATYSWKVRAFYGGTTYGNYSTTETFTVDPGANAVQPLIGSPNKVTINTSTPTISWVIPVQSKSKLTYELVYSKKEDMSDAQIIEGLENPFTRISGLESGEKYYWKVRSKTSEGQYSDYSPRASFSTDNATLVEEKETIPSKFVLSQNYPNPFNPSTVIEFALPKSEFVSLAIYDMLGREVAVLAKGEFQAGIHRVIWNGLDANGLHVASGTYLYRIIAGNNVVTKKMLLLK